MNKDLVIEFIRAASINVFWTMLNMQVKVGPAYEQQDTSEDTEGVLALVGIAGSWVGTGTIRCSPVFACRISSLLLMTECKHINEEVLDALAEIANMIFGNVKTALEDHVGPLGLSIPTVIFGKNFKTKQTTSQIWLGIPLYAEEMRMEITLALTPDHGPGVLLGHHFDHRTLQLAH